jgi:hypothetical protein
MAGARQQHHSTSRHVETPGEAQEHLHELCERTVFNLNNFQTLPFPPNRYHWGEILVDQNENGGIVLANIVPLNGTAENLMRPLTCFTGEGARVKGQTDVTQCCVIIPVCREIMPFIATVSKGADLIKSTDRGAESGALCNITGATV